KAVAVGIAPNLIECGKSIRAVERCVLDALGHYRAGELLEAVDKFALLFAAHLQRENVAHEVEQETINILAIIFGAPCGTVDDADILVGHLVAIWDDIRAIDGETGCDLTYGATNLCAREVAIVAAGLADLDEDRGEPVDVAAKSLLCNIELLVVRDYGKRGCVARKFRVVLAELVDAIRFHEHAKSSIQKVVSAGALNGPGCAQPLSRLKNLLADDPCFGSAFAQALKVLQRIAKAIRMVDAHAIKNPFFEPF